jgi:hypothetical protein
MGFIKLLGTSNGRQYNLQGTAEMQLEKKQKKGVSTF